MSIKKVFFVINGQENWVTTDENYAKQYQHYHATYEEMSTHYDYLGEYILECEDGKFVWYLDEESSKTGFLQVA